MREKWDFRLEDIWLNMDWKNDKETYGMSFRERT